MPFSVNTNLSSLKAQNFSYKNETSLAKSMEKLSSGLRINSSSDDAAGLAIAKGMALDVSGYEVNVRNANDAVSLLQIAEGGIDEIGNMLQRMKDLALQAANGSSSQAQRANLNTEFQQLIAEIDRIVSTTDFNGTLLLDGAGVNQTSFQVDTGNNATVDAIELTLNDFSTTALSNATSRTIGTNLLSTDVFGAGTTLTIATGTGPTNTTVNLAANGTVADMVGAINAQAGITNVTASLQNNQLVLFNSDANTVGGATITGAAVVNFGGGNTDLFVNGTGVNIGQNTGGTTLSAADITTQANSLVAANVLDHAVAEVTTRRATVGAMQNRFERTITNLNNKIVNVSAAMSRIMDADFAKETANFSKAQILQQASLSMMAQAKVAPSQLLVLLQ